MPPGDRSPGKAVQHGGHGKTPSLSNDPEAPYDVIRRKWCNPLIIPVWFASNPHKKHASEL